jgi:hypothetical protein
MLFLPECRQKFQTFKLPKEAAAYHDEHVPDRASLLKEEVFGTLYEIR